MSSTARVEMSNPPPDSELRMLRFLKNSYIVTKRTLQQDLKWRRLIEEDEGVIGHGWFASRREDPHHKLANILRLITILIFSHLYYFYFQSHISVHLDGSFIRWAWAFEKIELSDAILYNAPGVSDQLEERERFDPGQFKPRWLIQITFNKYGRPGEHDVRLVRCRDENEAVEGKRYTALSYAYDDARDLFKEWYPNVREGDIPLRDRYYPPDRNGNPHVLELMKKDPIMTAWNQVSSDPKKQETWNKTALRQRNARAFLDCYIDIRYEQWLKEGGDNNVEYVWLDEFCLYDPEEPSLETRNEELGRMADIFRFAEAVVTMSPSVPTRTVSDVPPMADVANGRWAENSGYTAQEYLGERDSSLQALGSWGENQLAPEWTYDFRNWTKSERDSMKRSTLLDLELGIMADCYIRECEDKPPNALVPLAVHGCGITCLIMHHHDDRTKAAVKLGIVNLAPYILNKGMVLAALEVGAVEERPRPVSFREFWKNI
ncbi:hypothetical protein CPB86DRAFT_801317 [Serendipita vermifera]|nr:hypothetical protein CPB86DRAFT_801317 [Serendipita vermifera]